MFQARKGYIRPRCIPCIFEVALKYLKLGLDQTDLTESQKREKEFEGIQKLIEILHITTHKDAPPNEIASKMFKEAANISNIADIWKNIRENADILCLKAIPYFEAHLASISMDDKKKRLETAIKIAVLGNNFDIGTTSHDGEVSDESIQSSIEQLKQIKFEINDFDLLWSDLLNEKNKRILLVLDNAGEIAFDKLLVRVLKEFNKEIIAAVKGEPISNDAIMEDAILVGLDKECNVITTGSSDLGYDPHHASPEFMDLLQNSEIVILKGMANFEAIYAYQHLHATGPAHYYSLLKIKCYTHAELLDKPFGSYVLKRIEMKDNSFSP